MNTLTSDSEEEAAAQASKVRLVLAETFARFFSSLGFFSPRVTVAFQRLFS